jgi:hypothetical protein
MNDQSLKRILRGLEIPEPDDAARERALHRAVVALKNADTAGSSRDLRPPRLFLRRPLTFCGAMGAAALLVFLTVPRPRHDASPATAQTLLEQMEIVFPGQLDAVIERDGKVEVALAAQPSAPSAQPLLLTFVRGSRAFRVLSYSGRRVCVEMDGGRICFDALLTGDGSVILSGDHFLWTNQNPAPLAGYQVEAAVLNPPS